MSVDKENYPYLAELEVNWNKIWNSSNKHDVNSFQYTLANAANGGLNAYEFFTDGDWNWAKLSSGWNLIGYQYSSSFNNTKSGNVIGGLAQFGLATLNSIGLVAGTVVGSGHGAFSLIGQNYESIVESMSGALNSASSVINNAYGVAVDATDWIGSNINSIADIIGSKSNSVFLSVISKGLSIFADGVLNTYKDGVTETSFGSLMENSWNKSANSFIKTFKNGSSAYTVNTLTSTPLDPGDNSYNLYGTLMLGAPPIFNHITDPRNRTVINTFLKDAKFLSLTPGMPKYNGSSYLMKANEDQMHQTTTGESMLQYLLRNGVDSYFASKDKRYYTFKEDYDDYYAYLETMLNTLWIKMGLATENNSTYNIYSFFDNNSNNPKLLNKYKSSLGFLVNPSGSLTESINSTPTSFGFGNAEHVNSASETYQQLIYNTGSGSGDNLRKAALKVGNVSGLVANIAGFVSDTMSNTISAMQTHVSSVGQAIAKPFQVAKGLIKDTNTFLYEKDIGVELQSFATTNGMRVVYPELWRDSSCTKSININFEFISPYGDPLSIFKYVMVPFAALLTFAMPRQAADNGFVSPFFVRADIPGLFTCDLGLITDINWTRGGNQDLWTKDGLPRAISGSFTIADLYPFLAMTKRLSFMSANPNYTVFLDSLAGLHSVYETNNDSDLNEYWKQMLNRVNGVNNYNRLWNNYSDKSKSIHRQVGNSSQTNRINGKGSTIDWMRKIQ